jgi:hypothetical protein
MEPSQTASSVSYVPTSSTPGMFGTKIPTSVAFVVGILLFFLPFTEIKSGAMKMATKSGLDYALGNAWKPVGGGLGTVQVNRTVVNTGKEEPGNTRYFIWAAAGLALLGLLLSFSNQKTAGSAGLASGIFAGGALVGFMIEMKKSFDNSIRQDALDKVGKVADSFGLGSFSDLLGGFMPKLAFTPWFYISIIAFIAAAIFGIMRMRSSRT